MARRTGPWLGDWRCRWALALGLALGLGAVSGPARADLWSYERDGTVMFTNIPPSGDKAHTIATLNVSLFEGTPNEVRKTVKIPLATPGSTRVLAWVHNLGGGRALVYVPTGDPRPTDERWPTNLDDAARQMQSEGGGGEGGY